MKRWPILTSFILFVGLCASVTFWTLQFFKPVVRPVAAPKQQTVAVANPDALFGLFGGRAAAAAAATNFQLKGVVVADNESESVAILVPDGKPAIAVRVDAEAAPGVTVKEVHPKYVLLSEGGAIKRVELPVTAPPARMEAPLAASPAMQQGIQQAGQQNLQQNTQPSAPPAMPPPAPPPVQPIPQPMMPPPGAQMAAPANVPAGRVIGRPVNPG
jgi:general secretion pathway protein C